jgi:tetratricopeptide (TPR) repeat protein
MTGSWSIDPETRIAMRFGRVRQAFEAGDWDECILEAEELLDENPSHLPALALLGQALLTLGDAQLAVLALEAAIRHSDGRDVDLLTSLAVARFEVCDLVECAEAAREVVRMAPERAEGHWYLGLALERLPGQQGEAITELAAARQLDPAAYPWPLDIDDAEWAQLVRTAMRDVHPAVRLFWDGIPIHLEFSPNLEELRVMDPPASPAVSGLYLGTLPQDGQSTGQRPDAMRLFQRNLAICRDKSEVVEQIAMALEAEALGWVGVASLDDL